VVPRQIRERGRVESHPGNPVLIQGVRGNLHARALGPKLSQSGELTMNADRIRGRVIGRRDRRRQTDSQGPHITGRPATELQRLSQQPGAGRLAVRPGDPHHGQGLRRLAEEPIGDSLAASLPVSYRMTRAPWATACSAKRNP
jgi:hypothetical protein